MLTGAQAPERLLVTITNAELASEPLDLSTVTAVTLRVTTPRGERTWTTTIETQTATLLELEHLWDALDVEEPGIYRVYVDMAVPGGVRRAGPSSLTAVRP
jgi:hypothetical protein